MMAKNGLNDELEIIGYFIWFWAFVFSKNYRNEWLQEFREENWVMRFFSCLEALSSILVGLIGPIFLIYYFYL